MYINISIANWNNIAISQTHRQSRTRLREIYLFTLIFNSATHNNPTISYCVTVKLFLWLLKLAVDCLHAQRMVPYV